MAKAIQFQGPPCPTISIVCILNSSNILYLELNYLFTLYPVRSVYNQNQDTLAGIITCYCYNVSYRLDAERISPSPLSLYPDLNAIIPIAIQDICLEYKRSSSKTDSIINLIHYTRSHFGQFYDYYSYIWRSIHSRHLFALKWL